MQPAANIAQFYADKTIFITGTTGFVGKVILEKIMRSLGNFRHLYVMVRAKKGMSNIERL
jgi:alcohol-forming fatty acyl-CoA reductase